jgi:hypothetical protein
LLIVQKAKDLNISVDGEVAKRLAEMQVSRQDHRPGQIPRLRPRQLGHAVRRVEAEDDERNACGTN